MTETQEERKKRLSGRMDEGGAWFLLYCLGVGIGPDNEADEDKVEHFTSIPRGKALKQYVELDGMAEHKRERHLATLMGLDGSPTDA